MSLVRKDFQGITDMYLDTAAYNLDPSFNYYLQDPKELDQRRLRAYKYYMDFYDGKHWDDTVGSLTMSEWNPAYGYYYSWNEDFNRRTWNVAKNIVDKLVGWLCQEEWKVKVPVELQPESKKPKVAERMMQYQQSGMGQQAGGQPDQGDDGGDTDAPSSDGGSDAPSSSSSGNNGPKPAQKNKTPAQEGGSTTSQMDPEMWSTDSEEEDENSVQNVLERFWSINSRHEKTYDIAYQACITGDCFVKLAWDPDFYAEGYGELIVQVLDSRTVMPFWDSHDKRKMIGCRIQYPVKEVQADGSLRTRMYSEVHTEGTIVECLDGQIDKTYPNPLGEIMIVHFPNEPLPYRKYGRSDLEALLLPQKEYNEKVSDFSEILAYHAAPVTIIKGARVQNLERGARKVWGGIPKDGDVFNLGLDSDLSQAVEYLNLLKKHMHETGNVPEEALGALQNVSNTSAAALHVQYQPLIERTLKKQIHFGKGFKRLNELVIKFYESLTEEADEEFIKIPDEVPIQKRYHTDVEWGDALPRDRSIMLADISTEMGLGIESKEGALLRIGVEAPKKKLEEIRNEQMEDAELQFQTAGLFAPQGMMGGPEQGAASGGEPQGDVSGAVAQSKTNSTAMGSNVAQNAVKKSAQTTLQNS